MSFSPLNRGRGETFGDDLNCTTFSVQFKQLCTVANEKKIEKGETIYQSPSSFIASAYNELYAFNTEKGEPIGVGVRPPPPSLNSPVVVQRSDMDLRNCKNKKFPQ